jgi:hypothetical protein
VRNIFAVILFVLLLATPVHAADLSDFKRPPMPQRMVVPAGAHLVKYEVESRFGASLTYVVGGATEQHETGAGVQSVKFVGLPGEFVYLSAQNLESMGRVSCRIYVDGEKVQEATSAGAYVIASCHAQIPR